MSWTKIKSDGRGGHNIHEDWTSGDETMDRGFPIFLGLAAAIFFGLILPIIMWIQAPFNDHNQNRQATFVSIISSLYVLVDFSFGGPLWGMFTESDNVAAMQFFTAIHVAFLSINIVLAYLQANGLIYFDAFQISIQMILFYVAAVVVPIYFYDLFHSIGESILSDTPMGFYKEYHYEQMQELAD